MFFQLKAADQQWRPLGFLAALGSGGLAISFFMYLMFWIPHPNSLIPTFSDVQAALGSGNPSLMLGTLIGLAGMLFFAINYLRLMIWNVNALKAFKASSDFAAFSQSNAHSQLSAAPLAVAMGINLSFAFGAVFIPGLWGMVEWLFPAAIVAFVLTAIWAVRTYLNFWTGVISRGGLDCSKNNNLSQILPAFSFAMIGVGLAAPAAMSNQQLTVVIASLGAIVLLTAAAILALVQLVIGMRALLQYGATDESLPSLMILVPLITLFSIAMLRLNHGQQTLSGQELMSGFYLLSLALAAQLFFVALGLSAQSRLSYWRNWFWGEKKSLNSYALICPGVALTILGFFWVNRGLVPLIDGLELYSLGYWLLTLPFIAVQMATIYGYWHLNHKLLPKAKASTPAQAS